MREGTAPLVRREDYAAPAYWIRRVDLTFDLDPAKTIVASKLRSSATRRSRAAAASCTAKA
jgi:aminopeptidase N